MYAQSVVILCVFVAGCYGFYMRPGYGRPNSNWENDVCALPTNPCRIQVTMTPFNTSEPSVLPISTEMCHCNGHGACPTDWSLQEQVIERALISDTAHMTFKMMFCQEIRPQRNCNFGEKALKVIGSLNIPTNVQEYNCRCSGNAPLQLSRSSMEDYQPSQEYVCDYFKQTCPFPAFHCLIIREDHTEYTCKCPNGLHCNPPDEPVTGVWEYPIHGYCN